MGQSVASTTVVSVYLLWPGGGLWGSVASTTVVSVYLLWLGGGLWGRVMLLPCSKWEADAVTMISVHLFMLIIKL